MFELISNMSGEVVSRHQTFEAAQKAAQKFEKGSQPDRFCPWRIEKGGQILAKYGQFEASGYEDGGW